MAALAEVQWTAPEKKNFQQFLKRLVPLVAIYQARGYNYAKHVFDVKAEITPDFQRGVQDIKLFTIDDAPIYYTLDGSQPSAQSTRYDGNLQINHTCTLKAVVVRPSGETSRTLTQTFQFNKTTLKPIKLLQPTAPNYTYKGAPTLVNAIYGGGSYRDGNWLGFYGKDMEAVIDLGQETSISKAWVRTQVAISDAVFDLRKFTVSVSDDGTTFREVKSAEYPVTTKESKDGIFTHEVSFDTVNARYLKLTASPEKKVSGGWHYAEGGPAFIFVDEIGAE